MNTGFVGIPFVDGGRDRSGCDCWGLVRIVFAERAGIDLPSYGDISANELLRIAREMSTVTSSGEIWRRVDGEARKPLDVVLMKRLSEVSRVPVHVGVMSTPSRVLHTVIAADSHTVPLTDPSIRTRIIGFFRHRDLA